MKVSKTICDLCGSEINESHPARIVVQKYMKSTNSTYSTYAQTERLDVCKDCEIKLTEKLREWSDEKDRE